ncbi:MAG: protein O-GlcNAc transferase [Acidobacteriota bacterium]|nr:protein O-GlcNAc transferase [Acidobacteriota bacterium]
MFAPSARLAVITLCILLLAATDARAQAPAQPARLERAAALISENRLTEAEQQLNSILKTAPNDALALNLLGTVRAKQGRLDEAEALFTRAVRADRQFVGAHMNLAYLYVLKGAPEKTAAELREVLRLDPGNADAGYKLARLLLSQGRLDECIRLVEDERRAGRLTPVLAVVLGDAYLKKGDAGKAEESYMLVLGAQDGNPDALLGMALVSQSKGDASAAARYLTRAREAIADSPELLYRFAVAALKSGLFDDARAALESAARLAPGEPAYLVALGAAWLKKPDLFEAERIFRQALQLRPDDPQAQMYLGYILLKQKKFPEAREWLEKSVKGDAAAPETFYYLGLVAQEQNEDTRAVEFFETAVRLSPSFANAHVALGSVYLKLKNYARAQVELEAGVRLNPDDSKAHYNLARLYAQLKDPQRAQAEMAVVEKLKSAGKTQEADTSPPSSPR